MALTFNNAGCQAALAKCESELKEIDKIIKAKGPFDNEVPFLTRYSIIISAGTLEVICKTMVADWCEVGANRQAKEFIRRNFRSAPLNVKFDVLCEKLNRFDESWVKSFKLDLKSKKSADVWKSHLNSLIELRNEFAHGGHPTTSFQTVYQYFNHAKRVMLILERHLK